MFDESLCQDELASDLLGFAVTVETRKDGGPVRPILSGRRARPVWLYYSLKCGTGMPCESGNELHALYHAEVATEVVRYRVQPCTLHFVIGGRVRSYTPDLEETLSDGRVRVTEVKDKFEVDEDPEYAEKLFHAAAYYGAKGQHFRVLERPEIEARPLFDAVDIVQGFRRTAVTVEDVMRIHERFAGREFVQLGEAHETFASAPLGFAKLSAMMVRRIIALDLTKHLSTDTAIRIMTPSQRRVAAQDAN